MTTVERQGSIEGYINLNLLFPDEDIVLIVMSNVDTANLFWTYARAGFSYDLAHATFFGGTHTPCPCGRPRRCY